MSKVKIESFSVQGYEIPLTTGQIRSGVILRIEDEKGRIGQGEIAPLPKWSHETLEEALLQLNEKREEIMSLDCDAKTCLEKIANLKLLPSVTFGLESALLSIIDPVSEDNVSTSALFMGSVDEIVKRAEGKEGSAKLKVSQLSFAEGFRVIQLLQDRFRLRIDVNRAWKTEDALTFFSQFSIDAFDYVEEPFQNPKDLKYFTHPLAVDESFPEDLSLEELEGIPMLKALVYKPTIQGGFRGCLPLIEWAKRRGIDIVLSSSFENELGLKHIARMAKRLGLKSPVGIGTVDYLGKMPGR